MSAPPELQIFYTLSPVAPATGRQVPVCPALHREVTGLNFDVTASLLGRGAEFIPPDHLDYGIMSSAGRLSPQIPCVGVELFERFKTQLAIEAHRIFVQGRDGQGNSQKTSFLQLLQ